MRRIGRDRRWTFPSDHRLAVEPGASGGLSLWEFPAIAGLGAALKPAPDYSAQAEIRGHLLRVEDPTGVENKRLGAVLAMIREEQLHREQIVAVRRVGAISKTPASSRSAELFYEPSWPRPLGKTPGRLRPAA